MGCIALASAIEPDKTIQCIWVQLTDDAYCDLGPVARCGRGRGVTLTVCDPGVGTCRLKFGQFPTNFRVISANPIVLTGCRIMEQPILVSARWKKPGGCACRRPAPPSHNLTKDAYAFRACPDLR